MIKTKWITVKYVLSDVLSSSLTWTLFYIYRKLHIEENIFGEKVPINLNLYFFESLVVVVCFWLLLFYFTGEYRNLLRKSRLQELGATFSLVLMGTVILFFVLILDDYIISYKTYYSLFFVLFILQFTLTYFPRLLLTRYSIQMFRKGKYYFKTLVIGSGINAYNLYKSFSNNKRYLGNKFLGYVSIEQKKEYNMSEVLPCLGESIDDIRIVVQTNYIDEVVIALDKQEKKKLELIISKLELLNVRTLIEPELYDILTGNVFTTSLHGIPLLEVTHELMPAWQENFKRFLDVFLSIFAIIVLIPVYITIAIGVKMGSKGPIFYSHTRIGRYGKPFIIYKFRSMVMNAEKGTPQLSKSNDNRITKIGLFLRKTRLDEIPQFYNVLIGNMSLVGPRPERQYFIDQIVGRAPHYYHLLRVRPGITSLGQVKFGYAENVNQMIKRLRYDIIYIENMSLYVDFKIMIYTIKIILEASGK